ncbi:MAG: hypothetical protein AAF378_22875 [Cyanobacteria bacterium P01_A01_bin.84]
MATINDVLKQRESDKTVKVPSAIDLHKKLVAEVKSVNSWYYETNKNVPQQALKELRTAWDRCLSETVSSTGIACGVDKPLRSHSKTTVKPFVTS